MNKRSGVTKALTADELCSRRVLMAVVAYENINLQTLAFRAGVHPSSLTKILRGRPFSQRLLKAVCAALKSSVSRTAILIAHLRDEAYRVGMPSDFDIVWPASIIDAGVIEEAEWLIRGAMKPKNIVIVRRKPPTFSQIYAEIIADQAAAHAAKHGIR